MDEKVYAEFRKEFHFIRTQLSELQYNSAVHNTLLKEHEARSLALQAMIEREKSDRALALEKEKAERTALSSRLQPVENHTQFTTSVFKWLGVVLAGLLIQAVVKLLF